MALFGELKEPFMRQFLRLRHGIPSHDTFSRVFRLLDPVPFEACFTRFMQRFAETLQGVVAIDGKTLRRSFDQAAGKSPLHMSHAWSADHRLLLGQLAVDGKSNEITAVPKLLDLLSLKERIMTADGPHLRDRPSDQQRNCLPPAQHGSVRRTIRRSRPRALGRGERPGMLPLKTQGWRAKRLC